VSIATLGLAFIAGVLSLLSPCVLPLVPIVLGSAASAHRRGPAALALGLTLSFTAIGLFVATIGFAIGLDADFFRYAGGGLLVVLGLVLQGPRLQERVAAAGGPLSNWVEHRFGNLATDTLGGQFALGLLLGAVWAPCVGPTLGAASLLAAQGKDLGVVALTMATFGAGAGLPLAFLGTLSREALQRWRGWLISTGARGKAVLGWLLIVLGVMIMSGLDKQLEAILVEASPAWLTELTTRY
jgi:cytochrome c biogenesis protein CcdA